MEQLQAEVGAEARPELQVKIVQLPESPLEPLRSAPKPSKPTDLGEVAVEAAEVVRAVKVTGKDSIESVRQEVVAEAAPTG